MQEFEEMYKQKQIGDKEVKNGIRSKLSMSEVMTILLWYHSSGYRTFKDFYTKYVSVNLKQAFPKLVSYNRFIELVPATLIPLSAFLQMKRLVNSDTISFVDSTKIAVCNNKRIDRNRTFKELAKRGKSTMGWFYGFKLHIVVNEKGELVGAKISQGNVDDRDENIFDTLVNNVSGKLFADKGYISQKLFEFLYGKGIQLVTNVRKNMKNRLIPLIDKLLLRKRSVIETINDQLKNMCDIEHSRHRSPINAFVNMIAGLVRYTYFEKKPAINFSDKDRTLLNEVLQIAQQYHPNNFAKGLLVA